MTETENTLGKSQIPYVGAIGVYDSSKIKTYQRCPRKYLLSHLFGWSSEDKNVHLVFGSAWHDAMEHLLIHGYGDDSVAQAFALFMETYNEAGFLDQHVSKNPERALYALVEYTKQYATDRFATLHTEIYGAVPIRQDRMFHVKLDSVLRYDNGIGSMEHKTGSRMTQSWINGWQISVQPGMYNYALWVLFPDEHITGVTINGAILRKNDQEFIRVPVTRDILQLESHVAETNRWIDKNRGRYG